MRQIQRKTNGKKCVCTALEWVRAQSLRNASGSCLSIFNLIRMNHCMHEMCGCHRWTVILKLESHTPKKNYFYGHLSGRSNANKHTPSSENVRTTSHMVDGGFFSTRRYSFGIKLRYAQCRLNDL